MASFSQRMRRIILEQAKRAGVGHIGSALSVVDILAALYERVLRITDPLGPERDRFILAKGHAALALYTAFYLRGWIDQELLNTYCGPDSLLGVHPEHGLPGVDFSTGSLGQGLPMGVGAALAARLQRSPRRVFVLVSDAELNEGAVWEAAMFAAQHQLANLAVIVDANGSQALGHTREILDLQPLLARWRAFGWDAREADGHDGAELTRALEGFNYMAGKPHVIVARTVLGKSVSFMEDDVRWHYLPMTDEQYAAARQEVAG
jgi:transketolase